MRALLLRRLGFATTLLTGLALTGSAVHGVSGMDTSLQVAATVPERPVLVSDHERDRADDWCDGPRDERRLS
jgi:hypothetical protein